MPGERHAGPSAPAAPRLVVTGLGVHGAAGESLDAFWQHALAGPSPARWLAPAPAPAPAPGPALPRLAACPAPDPGPDALGTPLARKADRAARFALAAARRAWANAAWGVAQPDPVRVAVVVGTSRGPVHLWDETRLALASGRVRPSLSAGGTLSSLSGIVAQTLAVRGPCATVSASCASGATAIVAGAQALWLGEADVALVGGAEAPLHPIVFAPLHAAGVYGSHPDPERTCRPFDITRNGLILGEGAAFLVLEREAAARARGARVWGRLAGWALGTDLGGRTGVLEGGEGLAAVVRAALERAGLAPADVGYVNLHGTGTRLSDAVEARALKEALGEVLARVPCSATKPVTGHCLGASPALEAVLCLLALHHRVRPPTHGCATPDPACALDLVRDMPRPGQFDVALSTSAGFWGNQAALLFATL